MDHSPISRIALVGQDAAIVAAIMATVRAAGHPCRHFGDAVAALGDIDSDLFDLLLVTGTRPKSAIAKLLTGIHARFGFALPVIGIIAADDVEGIVTALDRGMDHILPWPVAPGVLLAQVSAALRRVGPAASPIDATVGHVVFRREGMRVQVDGAPVPVTAKEYALGLMLCRNLGKPLGREYILRAIWGDGAASATRTLDVHVSRLRTKLQLRPERGFRLSALYGRGYRLDYSADDIAPAAAAITTAAPARPAGRRVPQRRQSPVSGLIA